MTGLQLLNPSSITHTRRQKGDQINPVPIYNPATGDEIIVATLRCRAAAARAHSARGGIPPTYARQQINHKRFSHTDYILLNADSTSGTHLWPRLFPKTVGSQFLKTVGHASFPSQTKCPRKKVAENGRFPKTVFPKTVVDCIITIM